MVGAAVYCLAAASWGGTLLGDYNHISALALYAVLMPIFIAMRTSLGETTNHTRSFSDGLPISIRARAGIRLAGGAAVLVVPIVVATALLSVAYALGWFGQVNAPPVVDHPAGLPDRESLMSLSVLGAVVVHQFRYGFLRDLPVHDSVARGDDATGGISFGLLGCGGRVFVVPGLCAGTSHKLARVPGICRVDGRLDAAGHARQL